jgi:uncharacterized RDD family membrane protein YckC
MPPQGPTNERLWFYSADDQSQGPERESDLRQRFASGALPMSTLVWSEGMAEWQVADETEVFFSAIPEVEAEEVGDWEGADPHAVGPQATPRSTLWPSRPEPFRRYLARQIDMLLVTYIYFLFAGPVVAEDMMSIALPLILTIPPWAVIEALCLRYWGYTPGKWVMRIEVTDEWGQRMTMQQSLRRSVDVAIRGMGLGIPILNVFTQVHSMLRLSSHGITPWDEQKRVVVRHPPLETWRWVALLVALVWIAKGGLPMLPSI